MLQGFITVGAWRAGSVYGLDSAEKPPSWMEFDIFDIAYRNAQRRA
jgi:hypothetical protein